MRCLSLLETRVLGVLIEKSLTVPDSYPLSINSLVGGCNQKTARDPILSVLDADVQEAVDALKALHLVHESGSTRVARYEHNAARVLGLPAQSVALLTILMLRGPQTSAELRMHSERLHRFADISSVDAFLEELAERAQQKGGPLVVKLPRAPGAREARWSHLLCGEVDLNALPQASDEQWVATAEVAALKAQQLVLQRALEALSQQVAHLYKELGLNNPLLNIDSETPP
jgi:uncharacterized protein